MAVTLPGLAAVAPLSPTQAGMLFDLLTTPREGMYVEQGLCTLTGPLDPVRFRTAWQAVVDRHPILRTSFAWKGLSQPMQVVHCAAAVPLGMDESGTEPMDAVAASHRRELQDLSQPCLMRLHLRQMGPDSAECLWSMHHLIHDAWSLEILLRDFFLAYAGALPHGTAPGFVESMTQPQTLPNTDAALFWRETLHGAVMPTPAPGERVTHARSEKQAAYAPARHMEQVLPLQDAEAASHVLATHGLTWNTLVLAAWAAVLATWNRVDHVVFGTVLHGRSHTAQLDVVGPCIAALPFGVRVMGNTALLDLLQHVQGQQMRMMQFDTSTLSEIKQTLGAEAPRSLFSSLIVFQNALSSVEGKQVAGLHMSGLITAGFPAHPLMLRVTPGRQPRLELVYDERHYELHSPAQDRPTYGVAQLLEHLQNLVQAFRNHPGQTVNEWTFSLPQPPVTEPETSARPRFRKLQFVKPKAFTAGMQERVLESGGTRVCVDEALSAQELQPWLTANAGRVTAQLKEAGAVLLRGFQPVDASGVEAALHSVAGEALVYRERSSPRTQVAGHIYTSTEHPPDQTIFFHNENSYAHTWPRKIAFYCKQPSLTGGATPLADVRRVLLNLPAPVRARFEAAGVRYLRNFDPYLGMSWQAAFQSSDPDEVMAACQRSGYKAEWRDGDRLRTWRTAPAVIKHPDTGEPLWFNHAAFFHLTTLEPSLRDSLARTRDEMDLPNQTFFGDGSPITPDVAEALRAAYRQAELSFPWQSNDLLLLDNMLIAHGRASFTGPRKILVGMAAPMGHTSGDTQ